MKHQQTFLLDKMPFTHPLTSLPLLSLSSTVFSVFLLATWVSLTTPWCGVWWVPGECTPSHPQSFPVCNPWVMALDACCTTRHWLSDCVRLPGSHTGFGKHMVPFFCTILVCLGTFTGPKLSRNGSTTTHAYHHLPECWKTFCVRSCFFCFIAPHLGAVFPIKEWKPD